jgi:hypothetical protein
VYISGEVLRAMIDLGATRNFISLVIIRKIGTCQKSLPYSIWIVDSTKHGNKVSKETRLAMMNFQGHEELI